MKKRRQKAVLSAAVIILTLLLIFISKCGPLKPCTYNLNARTANIGFGIVAAYQSMEPQDTIIDNFGSSIFQHTPLPKKIVVCT